MNLLSLVRLAHDQYIHRRGVIDGFTDAPEDGGPERREALKRLAGELLELRELLKKNHVRETETQPRK